MRARAGQLDVAQAFPPYLGLGDFDAALIANDAAMLHPLVLATQALPIGYRAEDLCTEQAVALGLECSVINRFGLGDLAVRPRQDFLRRCQGDPDSLEIGRKIRLLLMCPKHFATFPYSVPALEPGEGNRF